MAIDLLALTPHKVSRDLSGYVTYIYGEGKSGKTTLATHAPGSLLLAFEKGYAALPGVIAQDITSWSDVKAALRDLKRPEVKERFSTIIWDTIDIAGTLCEKYVCAQNGVDKIGEIPYGQGWTLMKKEFENTVRSMSQLGYAIFFISHNKDKQFTRRDGTVYNQTVPSCPDSFNRIAKDAADIYAYAEKYEEDSIAKVRLILRSIDNSADTGCRFKYITPVIPMDYDALVKALNDAIDKEAQMTNGQYVTTEREHVVLEKTYDFEAMMEEFVEVTTALMTKNETYFGPRITLIVDKIFGKGKRVADATLAQAELVYQALEEVKELDK